ncbi:Zinc-type alcohol dehydrogenase-like protein YogA like [Verticillium longisporum]|uniref:Zinc-type alcohol dehydrogenase-like protein YogA like n=1 Tax=Verticillium longisporum TaxID=100787 RepID=A0A8I3AEA7_VERLO|nr:Zinc-type alcohol dehydrogenase-like protein YogA like [Verticillium longisporum]
MPHSLTVKKIDGKPGKVYYPLQVNQIAKPTPGPNELLVKLSAAALNHRDLFIRRISTPASPLSIPSSPMGTAPSSLLGPAPPPLSCTSLSS